MVNIKYRKTKADYNNKLLLCVLFVPFLTSCGHTLAGYGHIKMVDPSCQPIKNIQVNVNNIKSSVFLNSGHLTKDTYTTDQQGQFAFDIEKSSNKVIVFLSDLKGENGGGTKWNGYTTTSNNDEILYLFYPRGSAPGYNAKFKTELLKSSVEKPIVFVYPYKKNTCNNNSPVLDEFNILKTASDRKEKIDAKEKARTDAIKVVIPKYKIRAYGIMEIYSVTGDAGYRINEINNYIKKEQQKSYTMFGVFVTASEPAVLKYSSDITYSLTYPKPGLTNPSTGITTKSSSMGYWKKHGDASDSDKKPFEFEMSMVFKEQWQIIPGEWLFQIKHKDSILLEQSFTVE